MTSESSLIETRSLSKRFRTRGMVGRSMEVIAVRDVSLTVAAGSSLGIVGESGSGKTTVARMLVGLERPSTGQVLIEGRPIRGDTADRRARARVVQMVFQDPYTSLDPSQTPAAAIGEVQRVHFPERDGKARRTRTLELLEAMGLGEREAGAIPRVLSGGQRQRIAIARSLAAEPRALILDEAVSDLDVSVQAQILNLLGRLRTEFGLAFVVISHDLAVVRQLADDVLVLLRGEAVELGDVDSVLAQPRHPYTKRLLAAVPRLDSPRAQAPSGVDPDLGRHV